VAAPDEDPVLVHEDGPVLVITINRPQARNAVNLAVSTAVGAAMEQLDSTPRLRCGVLTGVGGFCAGMDLKAFVEEGVPLHPERGFAGTTDRPPAKPLVAAVEKFALAGGFELALATDLIVAGDDAVFGLPEVKHGLIAAARGLVRLGCFLPHQAAAEISLLGDPIPASRLHQWGVVARLTPPGEALAVAMELAHRIASNAPLAVAASKAVVGGAVGATDGDMVALQDRLAATVLRSHDAREGAKAFAEKRSPTWSGS
jgi:enoyl-CoA hydratase